MLRAKSVAIVILCATMVPSGVAQTPEPKAADPGGWHFPVTANYLPRQAPPLDFENSPRMESLMRAGKIYLSLQDAIALALENNLDIEYARFEPRLAIVNEMRASAGTYARASSSSTRTGSSSASLGSSSTTAVDTSSSSSGGATATLSSGASLPSLDPSAYVQSYFTHTTSPQTSSLTTGTNFLVSEYKYATYGVQKGFLTGTTASLGMTNTIGLRQNSPTNDFNPTTSAALSLNISQHLLQGFGRKLNSRNIRIAKNQRVQSDLTFRQQVMATVANVVNLYYDLVAFNDGLKVKQRSLELNQKLYEDNKRRAELGAIAPIDIVQAEAEVASSQQDVTTAETQVLQQEMILKNALTRTGVDNMLVANARIVPLDRIDVPEREPIRPVQDLVGEAFQNRPEIESSRVSLENSRISMTGTRNALLPVLDVYATLANRGLAGQVNDVAVSASSPYAAIYGSRSASTVNGYFLGGYGTVLSQIVGRNFPDYTVGFNFSIPIRNRSAQADLISDQLNYRRAQINDRQLQNNVRVNVMNARTALYQSRAAYDTSVKARMLQEQTLNGTRRKYQLGTSSFLDVVITQRDTVTREVAEVNALNQYVRSRVSLQQVTGSILRDYSIDLAEASSGQVKRPSTLPPVLPQESKLPPR